MKARAVLQMKAFPPIFYHNANIPPLKLQYMSPQSIPQRTPILQNLEIPQLISENILAVPTTTNEKWINNARCTPFVCPEILKKNDVLPLFPEHNLNGELTMFTIVHQTQNDMADWNAEVFEERDQLVGDVCRFVYLLTL
jgi:hypothetical protein